ncbi:MAG: alpha-amylase [Calditrichaeota bacterium]|nr:alpha-amylase [Calditrichota bacterium]
MKQMHSPQFYFHVNKKAREKYEIEQDLFSIKGRVVFTNFNATRKLSDALNKKRDLLKNPELAVNPSIINALGLMDEIIHFMIETYRQKVNPKLLEKIQKTVEKKYTKEETHNLLKSFVETFPTNEIFKTSVKADEYLENQTEGFSNKQIVIEEMIAQWVQNQNKAYFAVKEIIDDKEIQSKIYNEAFKEINNFFKEQPNVPGTNLTLLEMLLLPGKLFPDSVYKQLEYIRDNWGVELKDFLTRILLSLDVFKEEAKKFIPGMFSKPENKVAEFHGDVYDFEPEAFSPDLDWMPHLVLIAKSTYVWLDQLSKKYQREIKRLDQIPDEELNRLANFGFTGLWFIGIWERSYASQKIKQINGNPEAVASAYSLKNYEISQDLGGFEAYSNLKERAWKRGIRLASDMVPNHMAIDSDWVKYHPHWFIQSNEPPFPNHTFNGPNLSENNDIGIYLEDGYWNKSDAAVEFKRIDHRNGETRYIYHGNDGTGMPWNDTAQLNYLMPEVREAVIQTILHVARLFPVIRFDAAMTLAKKHYQRLWFPEPGSGGDIPTRSFHSLSKDEFNMYFPVEFWREVVDRVAQECPDTLLLAEAFWMMEGYFVRSLGMHRVYNSAFMNMLKNEENDKYRQMIKNVLEFNPQILKRYVNFMNNPDEETAVAQFGKEDKYFGTCILMCTMPGLPMFGHGQIEGFSEKYGMEYKRAYWEEQEDHYLVERHRREVFPLMKKRKLFSEVENFYLYNFQTVHNTTDENVYCYSNRYGDERSLVVYNNAYNNTAGWIKYSTAFKDFNDQMSHTELAKGLNLKFDANMFTIFREHISGKQYIRSNKDLFERGLFVELGGYKYQVFLSFQQVYATRENPYDQLNHTLNGKGVDSIEIALHEIRIAPALSALYKMLSKENILIFSKTKTDVFDQQILDQLTETFNSELAQLYNFLKLEKPKDVTKHVEKIYKKQRIYHPSSNVPGNKSVKEFVKTLKDKNREGDEFYLYKDLLELVFSNIPEKDLDTFYDFLMIEKVINTNTSFDSKEHNSILKILVCHKKIQNLLQQKPDKLELKTLFSIADLVKFLKINTYQDVRYYNKENWELILEALLKDYIEQVINDPKKSEKKAATEINRVFKRVQELIKSANETGYDLDKLISTVSAG